MSLVELIIATGVLSFVLAGSIASTLMFIRLAANHERRAEISSDLRVGMELLSFDVRNASRISSRTDTSFSLTFVNSPAVQYAYNKSTGEVVRTENNRSRVLFNQVSAFDLLTGPTDEPTDGLLTYDSKQIAIETLQFGSGLGSSKSTNLMINNLRLSLRK